MDIYASDDEKGEEIKQWWRDNGRSVIVSIVLSAVVIFAGRYWFNYQATMATKASLAYQQLVTLLTEDKKTEADEYMQQLLNDYSNSPYTVFAAFDMAAKSVEHSDIESSKTKLQWIIEHAELSGHKALAQLRLSQLLLAESKFDQAFDLVSQKAPGSFASLFSELQGDIFAAQGKDADARTAYQTAMMSVGQDQARQQILALKLNDMAISQ